ncbi:hypothetical protein LCGC14_2110230, partial [marine sediment metagenome]
NIIYLNTHELKFEFYRKIWENRFNGQIDFKHDQIHTLFGKNYITKEMERLYFEFASVCSLFENNRYLWDSMGFGFLPSNYCSERCPFRYECLHKSMRQDVFNAHKLEGNNLSLVPKSYIHTGITDSLLNTVDGLVGILDENNFSLMYEQEDFKPYLIDKFIDKIENLLRSEQNNDLYDFWNRFCDLLDLIKRYVIRMKSIKVEKKEQLIIEEILDFLESYNLSDMEVFNEELKELITSHTLTLRFPNIINNFINLLDDITKLKDEKDLSKNLVLDEDNKTLSYFIKKVDRINELFKQFKKVILTDATMIQPVITRLFPEFIDDILTIGSGTYINHFKEVYIDNNLYHKPTLWNIKANVPTKSFNILSKKLGWLLEEYKDRKTFIAGFKVYIPQLKKDHKEKTKIRDIRFDHFGNIEGKNKYNDCEVVIVFGSPGKPKRVTDVFVNLFDIDRKFILDLDVQQQIIQIVERIRPIKYKNQKIAIILTSEAKESFPSAKDLGKFTKHKYKGIISYLAKNGWTSTKEILKVSKKTKPTTRKLVNILLNEGFLKSQKGITSVKGGRPPDLWNVT